MTNKKDETVTESADSTTTEAQAPVETTPALHEMIAPAPMELTVNPREMLENAMLYMIRNNGAFYSELLMQMHIHQTTQIPTAGVNIKNGKINLYYNPYFLASMNIIEQAEVLKHECKHLIHNHIPRAKALDGSLFNDEKKERSIKDQIKGHYGHQRFNYAADCAINQYLPNLPKKMMMFDKNGAPVLDDKGAHVGGSPITLESFKQAVGTDALPHMHMEYYHQLIQDSPNKNKMKQKGSGQGGGDGGEEGDGEGDMAVDDHSLWGDSDDDLDKLEETIKAAAKKAAENASEHMAGNLPSDIQAALDAMNKPSVAWKAQLRRFIASSEELKTESTRKRRNRRYGITFPGHKSEAKLRLAVAVDTSGSVSDEALAQFWGEMDAIHRHGASITVIEADCVVQNIYDFDPRKKPGFQGRGGTAYKPAIDKAIELNVDGIIYFGDMDNTQETLTKPPFPMLWAIVGKQEPPEKWGAKVHIEVGGKKNLHG